ncbi:MAG: lactonase family protein [Planctomycetota bacterium]
MRNRLPLLFALPVAGALLLPAIADGQIIDVWLGTSANRASKGIYHTTLDTQSGKLSPHGKRGNGGLAAEIRGPGFLCLHPSKPVLYAVGNLDGVGSVVAYKIQGDPGSRTLALMSSVAVGDAGACHVSVHPKLPLLITAQYSGGSCAVFELDDNGGVVRRKQLLRHEGGSGIVARRQDKPHAHWSGFSPDGRFAFVPDLGMDAVVIYSVDSENLKLTPHGKGQAIAGGGPRHMKFHPSGKYIYLLNELDLSVTVFDYDAKAGTMTAKQTVAAVDKDELAKEKFASASEIRVSQDGRFVYSANRGHDTLTAYRVDAADGKLSVIQRIPIRGATPRNFALAADDRWVLAAGQDSHTLAVFQRDAQSGLLTYHRSIISTPAPICVLPMPKLETSAAAAGADGNDAN